MNIEFVKELDGHYVLIRDEDRQAGYERQMLLACKSPLFLPARSSREGEGWDLRYEISGRQSLEYLTKSCQMEERMMRDVLNGIYRSCEEAEQYLLRPSGFMLEPGLIFKGKEGWSFLYHPHQELSLWEQLQKLSRFFLRKCNHEDENTSRLAYELLRVCHEENTSFTQIWDLWEEYVPALLVPATGPGGADPPKSKKQSKMRWFRREK